LLEDQHENSMTCEIMDGLPHALTKAATLVPDVDSDQPLLLLDWGARSTSICICVAAQPVYTRTLQDQGFGIVEKRISNAMGVTAKEASQILSEFGLPDGDVASSEIQTIIDEIMSPTSTNLFDEILRTVSFLKSQQADLSVRQGLVFGAGATTNNIGLWLSNKLGISIQPWSCFKNGGTNPNGWPVELLGPAIAASSQRWSAA
jgi:Tfp pilus assembly PilM family ATPase